MSTELDRRALSPDAPAYAPHALNLYELVKGVIALDYNDNGDPFDLARSFIDEIAETLFLVLEELPASGPSKKVWGTIHRLAARAEVVPDRIEHLKDAQEAAASTEEQAPSEPALSPEAPHGG